MKIIPIPCAQDNYAYLILCEETGESAVVDPCQFAPVDRVIRHHDIRPTALLCTHHHADHVGGVEELLQAYPGLRVWAHASDRGRIPGQNGFANDGDTLTVGKIPGRVLHTPGHTRGSVVYHFDGAAFTGDSLFSAGCGRLFEGSAEQMYHSLNVRLASLTDDVAIYFGHEYTESNLRFARHVEPSNPALLGYHDEVQALRRMGKATTPSTMGQERLVNPFLRCHTEDVQDYARRFLGEVDRDLDPAEVFGILRGHKDRF